MAKKTKAEPATPSLRSQQRQAALEEYEKGIRLLRQRDYQKALPRFETILESYPGEVALCDRARIYMRIASGEVTANAPVRSTREADQAFEVGVFLLNDGEFKDAVKHLERAREHQPEDAWVHEALASARLQLGDRDGSVEALTKAVELEPGARFRIRNSTDFESLMGDERLEALLARD